MGNFDFRRVRKEIIYVMWGWGCKITRERERERESKGGKGKIEKIEIWTSRGKRAEG